MFGQLRHRAIWRRAWQHVRKVHSRERQRYWEIYWAIVCGMFEKQARERADFQAAHQQIRYITHTEAFNRPDELSYPDQPGWYFIDESEQCHGPYQTGEGALAAFNEYCKELG
jgi:hypothetical protein